MPKVKGREYRAMMPMNAVLPADDQVEQYRASGYATTFDKPYLLYEIDGVKYYERVDPHALDEADLSDVIMQFDHHGRVFARTSNNTLVLSIDAHGFKVDADLSLTQSSRQLHEEIKAGLITKMSWSFIVTADAYDSETHTRSILKVKKVYDVSAVSIPADADTDISARSYCDGVIRREQAERLARRKRILSMTIDSVIGGNEQ